MERGVLSTVHMMHWKGDCHLVSPFTRCFVASVSEELHLDNAPRLIFFKYRKGDKDTGPKCERPSNGSAGIHNRLILYMHLYIQITLDTMKNQ